MLVVAWLVDSGASILFPTFEAPGWVMKVFVIVVAARFSDRADHCLGIRDDAGRDEADRSLRLNGTTTVTAGRAWIRVVTDRGAILASALFFLGRYTAGPQHESSESADSGEPRSIAVLPLVNTSGDPANDYFSDGLSEELIAVLAKIPGLKIIGRSSSFLFKGKSDDSRTIGEKLGVTNLLEGSVRKQGDRVRIVAELINAADGRTLWSETYDRELKDVFAVQSEIATAVTEQLKIKLLGAPAKSDAAPSNDNLAAYNALQQGTFYFRLSTEEGTRKATEFYGEAIRLDPRYALAYAQLSAAWRQLAATWLGGALKPTKPMPRRGTQRKPPCRSRPISPLRTKRSASYW